MQHAVAHQNESGVIGHLAPLMKIESQRVRALDALEPGRQIRSQNRQRAIGAVHVEPEPLALANAGQRVEVIDGPRVDGAGGSHHEERHEARAAIRVNGFLQGVQIDPKMSVYWNQAERIAADAGDVHGFPDAVVGRH